MRAIDVNETSSVEQPTGTWFLGALAAVLGWLIPGLGHLLLRRWTKAIAYFVCVIGLAYVGLVMRGAVFAPGAEDMFDRLGFFADIGTGAFYFLAHAIQTNGADVAH